MSESQRFQLGTVGALSLSVVSSVSIVICNKALMSTLAFNFGELLKTLCQLDSAVILQILSSANVFVFSYAFIIHFFNQYGLPKQPCGMRSCFYAQWKSQDFLVWDRFEVTNDPIYGICVELHKNCKDNLNCNML